MKKSSTDAILQGQIQQLIANAQSRQELVDIHQIQKFAIIATPRVGSGMLSKRLEATEVLGWPVEWFNQRYVKMYLNTQGSTKLDFTQYLSLLLRGTISANNIFGVKFHIAQYLEWKKLGIDLLDIGFDKIYWIERKDKIKQAYSYAKTAKTDLWSKRAEKESTPTESPELEITPLEVAIQLASICQWCQYYEENMKASTDRVFYYEDLAKDQAQGAVQAILDDFSLPADHIKDSVPTHKQSTHSDVKQISQIKHYFVSEDVA